MKSISGANDREGTVVRIGDNRYGTREMYDDAEMKKLETIIELVMNHLVLLRK